MRNKILCILFLISGEISFSFAQSTTEGKDSAKVYRDIEKFSKKRKSTNLLYQLFFKPVETTAAPVLKKKNKSHESKPYIYFEGKIIRNISIVTLDPFGYNLKDTVFTDQNILYKAGNSMHIKTLPITIRNLLLFRKNEPFDSLLVKESERLIRSQKYVHDVFFYTRQTGKNSDSVDVFIRELDEWSIIPDGSLSTSVFEIDLTENNFLGTGHRLQNEFIWNHTTGRNAQKVIYFIPNIHNTYINSSLLYSSDEFTNTVKSVNVERPFFSSVAKWAAGISVEEQFRRDSIILPDSVHVFQTFRKATGDYWAGKSWQIVEGNSEDNRATNLILTTRYIHSHYSDKPPEVFDYTHSYYDESFYLAGIGISTRRYEKDSYVFNYGVTEDVPIGNVYEVLGGYQVKKNAGRVYVGLRISNGNYFKYGYLSTSLEYGTYIRSTHFEQGNITASANYFTGLFEIGRWKFRQFVKPQLTLGINRLPEDTVRINSEGGIKGFESNGLAGQHKLLLTVQTQSYSPWNVLGFQFGPYFISSFGILGTEKSGFRNSRLYSQFGLGVLIKNEFLVFGTFQFSFAYYPVIPGLGDNIFKYNPDKTSDIGFRDFNISKPGTIPYE